MAHNTSSEIGPTVFEIITFFKFSSCRPAAIVNLKSRNYIGWRDPEGQDASPCQISSKSLSPYIAIFQLFKITAVTILDLWG